MNSSSPRGPLARFAALVFFAAVIVASSMTGAQPISQALAARAIGPYLQSEQHEGCLEEEVTATEDWDEVYDALGPLTTLSQASSGALLYATDIDGLFYEAPNLEQNVTIEVYGLIARTRVEQRFFNPTERWLEGIYVFPLPERSAVDELRMRIGEREVLGVIQEKEEAKKIYEAAKQAGQRASLVEQERPNIFTNSVANIGPQEEIVVTIEYQEDLRYDDGRISLRFPMVVAPRFNPGHRAIAGFSGSGWGVNTDQVPDAERITPPVVLTSSDFGGSAADTEVGEVGFTDLPLGPTDPAAILNPLTLTVFIDHNLVLDGITSPSHSVMVTDSPQAYVVELDEGAVPANRDFVLEWWPDRQSAPQAALYTSDVAEHTYAHLMVVPPEESSALHALRAQPRELVLVIDTSGSMGGTSIEQAKAAVLLALERLQPHDTFDVVEFNSVTRALFSSPQPAGTANIAQAERFVRRLDAGGGTNLLGALELSLAPHAHEVPIGSAQSRVRQVVFVTDGSVGNEDQLFRTIEQRLGERRLFTVGIGSAPNHHFMRRAAQFGRGTFTAITDLGEVSDRMRQLFRKLESPALVDLEVEWRGWNNSQVESIEAWPQQLPDLYAGEPIVLNARLPLLQQGQGELVLRGQRGGQPWETSLAIERGAERSGVDRLWARQKIRSLMDEVTRGQGEEVVRPLVVELGLRHHLVTRFTSLIAVDTVAVRPLGEELASMPIPVRLPAGWDPVTTFGAGARGEGPLPAGGTASRLALLCGLLMLVASVITWRRGAASADARDQPNLAGS